MSSPEPGTRTTSLRGVARRAIAFALREGREAELELESYPCELREPGASFVTLERLGALRGCTGSLEAVRPLVRDVAHNAWRSAFRDPRFPALRGGELADLEVHVSVLSPMLPLPAASESELLSGLRPGIDGLVLRDGRHTATFLPAVWETLPEPLEFLDQLRLKAGLPRGHWTETLRFERYTVTDAD